jgi:hypothetical protein
VDLLGLASLPDQRTLFRSSRRLRGIKSSCATLQNSI